MNNADLQHLIDLIQAHLSGRVIEFKMHHTNTWRVCSNPNFNLSYADYRVQATRNML